MDADKFLGTYANIYTENYGLDNKYSINSINDSSAHIPLFVRGNGDLRFTDVDTWVSGYDLTLEDLATGQMIPITNGLQYSFLEPDSLNFVNRFVVHLFGGSELGVEELENDGISIVYENTELIIKSDYINRPVQLELVNLMGQVLSSEKVVLSKEGYRMKRPTQVMILRIVNAEVNMAVKVF